MQCWPPCINIHAIRSARAEHSALRPDPYAIRNTRGGYSVSQPLIPAARSAIPDLPGQLQLNMADLDHVAIGQRHRLIQLAAVKPGTVGAAQVLNDP